MHLIRYSQKDLHKYVVERPGETKAGEKMATLPDDFKFGAEAIAALPQKFVVMGVEEDIGVQANHGRAGTQFAWHYFLQAFLNQQHNTFFNASKVLLAGKVEVDDLTDRAAKIHPQENERIAKLRALTAEVDDRVLATVEPFLKAGKTVIFIGGGHNNSYPLLKSLGKATGKTPNCINLDPHADFRPLEGRHSGNGFSYARQDGFLGKYFIVGLHEGYNSEATLQALNEKGFGYITYEDIFIREKYVFESRVSQALDAIDSMPFGVELDTDSIRNFPSSAMTPSGVSVEKARFYTHLCGSRQNSRYLHLCEAAPTLTENGSIIAGKTLSYLATDFIKSKG